MKYKVGDTVLAKRDVYKNNDKKFSLKDKVKGVIIAIPTSRRFAVVDTGLYRESFRLNKLKYIKE